MSWDNRVLWSEGLFLTPHHFQQHDRYLENLARRQPGLAVPYPWGLRRLAVDRDLLSQGKLALTDCAGVLPDGTPFDCPASDPLPPPLDLGEDQTKDPAGQTIYLSLPLARPGAPESGGPDAADAMLRYRAGEIAVRDNTLGPGTETPMEVGRLALRQLYQRDARDGFACCGIARVLERRPDRQVLLDPAYIPPCLDIRCGQRISDFVEELQGLLHRQGESRAARVRGVLRGGVSDLADFLLLQIVNRAEPTVVHLSRIQGVHPESLFRYLVGLAGELATLGSDDRRPPDFPAYRHDDLEMCYGPLIERLRQYLSRETVERAIAIPIQERQFGFRIALVADRTLLASARFVLAAQAEVDSQTLRNRIPTQIKVGPLDKIQELVKLALPGIALKPLPTAPQEIPFHAGNDYFELDRSNPFWKQLGVGGGFGLHVGGEFPGLKLELWAIRE